MTPAGTSEYAYNAANQLVGLANKNASDVVLTEHGDLLHAGTGDPTTRQGTALTFDVENRMTAYGNTLTAGYRGDGLRAWKESANGRRYFLYDGITVVAELDADGDLVGTLTHGAAGLLSYNTTQYQMNSLGDAAVRLDGSGTVLSYPLFDAWGNLLTAATGEPCGYKAQFGYYTDLETGLVALAYRYYAPGVGRFLNRDPIGYWGGILLYAYGYSDPVQQSDPSGTGCEDDCGLSYLQCVGFSTIGYAAGLALGFVACQLLAGTACSIFPPPLSLLCQRKAQQKCLGMVAIRMAEWYAAALLTCMATYAFCLKLCPSGGGC